MSMSKTHADLCSKVKNFHAHFFLFESKMRKKEKKYPIILMSDNPVI